MDFPVNDAVMKTCRHAATIARWKYQGLERGMVPSASSETATVTFIKINDKTYAVTARHVIETLDCLAAKEGRSFEGYSCIQAPGIGIGGPFLTPPPDLMNERPDIAMSPIHPDLPARIGKASFEIFAKDDAKWPVSHALAVGFPTVEKREISDKSGAIGLTLPCVQALAEGLNSTGSSDQVQFHSELTEKPSVVSLSGMSGGPVFWANETDNGLLGFVKEALDVTPKAGEETFYTEPKVNFICQRVDFAILDGWAKFIDAHWQDAREKRNAEIVKMQSSKQ